MRSIRTPAERAVHGRIRVSTQHNTFERRAAESSSTETSSQSSVKPTSSSSSTTSASKPSTTSSSHTTTSSTGKTTSSSSSPSSHSTSTQSTTTTSHTSQTTHTSTLATTNHILPPSGSSAFDGSSPTSAAANDASQNSVSAASKGPSGAVIGVVVTLVILLVAGISFFFFRKRAMRRREMRRKTWGAGIFSDYKDKDAARSTDLPPPLPEKAGSNDQGSPTNAQITLTPPPMSYNNPIADHAYGSHSPTLSVMSGSTGNMETGLKSKDTAVVRCVFIPSLPDELSITSGEVVYVLMAYDDGWAFCENARGEQGMIPLECLGRNGQASALNGLGEQEQNGSTWRNSKRVSSLHGGSSVHRF